MSKNQIVDITEGVSPEIVKFYINNSKKETYLYNNRLFFGYSKPTQEQKDQYDRNWRYIKSL